MEIILNSKQIKEQSSEVEEIKKNHKSEYEKEPETIAMAPGRFHLLGEHTSFFKDKTLSMAVNLPVYIAVSLRGDTNLNFNFVQLEDRKRSNLIQLKFKKEDKWANAIKAVLFGFLENGFNLKGMNFTVYSNFLPSAGFGITTAIKVATAWAVKDLLKLRASQEMLLKVLETANKKFLNILHQKADYFTPIYSRENSLVLTDYSNGTYEILPFNFKNVSIVLTDAGVPRVTTWNEESLQQPENVLLLGELKQFKSTAYGGWVYEESAAEINEVLSVVNEDVKRRLICVMQEHKNVLDCVSAIQKGDFSIFARAVKHSQKILRDLYDLSCPEIDWILKRVSEIDDDPNDIHKPVNCGRITGKGFGRCTYSFVRNVDVERYKEKLLEYERIFGFKAEFYTVKSARGVHLI